MNNKEIAKQFSLLGKLMDIHGEDSFKAKTYNNAAFRISQIDQQLSNLDQKQTSAIPGIGTAIAQKISELLQNGNFNYLEKLIEKTPVGIFQMLQIKGLGAKKIQSIWKDMGIETIDELLEAIDENKLIQYPGFGEKTQQNIKESIDFFLSQEKKYLFGHIEDEITNIEKYLKEIFPPATVELTGEARRHSEIVSGLEFVIASSADAIFKRLKEEPRFMFISKDGDVLEYENPEGMPVVIHASTSQDFLKELFDTTGSDQFISEFDQSFPDVDFAESKMEKDIFVQAGIQYVPAFLRDTPGIITLAEKHGIPDVIQPGDIRGLIHCHTTWSDAVDTIEEMANACIGRGLEYMVLSDHSKAAFYAKGLDEKRVALQQKEVDALNHKLAPFKIFKSIECDILSDGSLDYDEQTLKTFDLVIVSIHSNLKMAEEKATARLIKAIGNPHTTILGHMTGRLLLKRSGYLPDYKKVIDACAANNVVIEINANPRRLDVRWQWIPYALSKGVLLSVNPDAHSVAEIDNNRYGVLAAQKGLLTKEQNLSSFSLKAFEKFLQSKSK